MDRAPAAARGRAACAASASSRSSAHDIVDDRRRRRRVSSSTSAPCSSRRSGDTRNFGRLNTATHRTTRKLSASAANAGTPWRARAYWGARPASGDRTQAMTERAGEDLSERLPAPACRGARRSSRARTRDDALRLCRAGAPRRDQHLIPPEHVPFKTVRRPPERLRDAGVVSSHG